MLGLGKIRVLSRSQKIKITTIVLIVYTIAFAITYNFFQNAATILSVIPIFFIAYIFGIRGGILSGITIYFVHSLLIYIIGSPYGPFYFGKNYLFYHTVFLFSGISAGYISRLRRKLEKSYSELIESKNQLKIINQILRHDLANNLTVINSSLNLYKSKNQEKFLIEAEDRTRRGLNLIKKMRELEYIMEKPDKLKTYNTREIIRNIRLRYTDVAITCYIESEIMADAAVVPLFDNLISNSILHGNARNIEITSYNSEDNVIVEVKDDGYGIPDEIKEKIFEEGFTYGGSNYSGLGLYIVRKVMNRYGGEITVKDNLPKGSVFILTFNKPG